MSAVYLRDLCVPKKGTLDRGKLQSLRDNGEKLTPHSSDLTPETLVAPIATAGVKAATT